MYASLESQCMPYLPGITLTNNIPKSDSNNSHYKQVDNDKNNKYINCKKMYTGRFTNPKVPSSQQSGIVHFTVYTDKLIVWNFWQGGGY